MLKRLLTGIVIIALTVGFFALRFVSAYFFDAFVMVIALLSTFEVCRALNNNKKFNDMYFVLSYPILCFLMLFLSISFGINLFVYFAIIVAVAGLIFVATYLLNLAQKNKTNKEILLCESNLTRKKYVMNKSLRNLFLTFYPAFILSLLFVINHLKDFSYFAEINGNLGFFLLVMLFVSTIMTDTGAYILGSAFGGKKLCPNISPKKTISGAVGGVVVALLVTLSLYAIFASIPAYQAMLSNLQIWYFVLFGIFASVYTQVGDIFASLIKRRNGIKDYGNILPGHGGFMDRVDGLSFNAIFVLIFAMICFM